MNREQWYSVGLCTSCGKEIVRCYRYRGDGVGIPLTYVCDCPPKHEKMRMVGDTGVLVVWYERELRNVAQTG